jgi:hypothetical protein
LLDAVLGVASDAGNVTEIPSHDEVAEELAES